ncbi:unnamed protein product [Peronospora belbahrii]|uniref:Elicitin n=1 Tax=Peronospora belbahrii TaxID=622444 RepID=A0AAU9KX29_9STRA|nr:unnamed protein product [Peronospora belbahrii]CAH0521360.1 unnamed protein product [Peronospora belbahrii]
MNLTALLVVTIAALIGSTVAGPCSTTETFAAINTLTSLLKEPSLNACKQESGYSMVTATALPTTEQKKKMCNSANCNAMIEVIIRLQPPPCELTLPTGLSVNVNHMANGFSSECTVLKH